jgi:hypothetical protein
MKEHEQFMLPDELRNEVAERLVSGLGVFGPFLAARMRRGSWRLWTILPKGAKYSEGQPLDAGGVAWADLTVTWLSRRIDQFLRRKREGIAIFENDPARKGDAWLNNCKSKVVYVKARVFHYVQSGDSAHDIERAIRDAQSYPLVGAIIESVTLNFGHDLTEDDLLKLSSLAVAIIQDAFDGESYIVAEPVDGPSIAPPR